ncbi:hypothetical protein PFISCL1PPCAC_2087 [Pristionchus fissidentatus]|uniref:Secreted protein n=1 Tax=Pristionchus fissidentatus TaxID=1538716 RepID=A0AAV5UU64_9BILA|nr:hypothetical protein PFISCL1PPCAC_2087 [Pristionchus fissidentatus]
MDLPQQIVYRCLSSLLSSLSFFFFSSSSSSLIMLMHSPSIREPIRGSCDQPGAPLRRRPIMCLATLPTGPVMNDF